MDNSFNLQSGIKGFHLFAAVAVMCYCAFNLLNGERSVFRYFHLQKQIAEAQQRAADFQKERLALEEKVHLLSKESLDLDMLDERARVVLNFIGPDEFVILDKTLK